MIRKINVAKLKSDQKTLFFISGLFQYSLDVTLYAILVLMTTDNTLANIISRSSVGLSGFFINGMFVFKTMSAMSKKQVLASFFKFLLLLFCMTILSNVLIGLYQGDSYLFTVVTKMSSEVFLAVLSYLVQRFFVYKPKSPD